MNSKTKKTHDQRPVRAVGSGRMVRGLLYMHTLNGKPAYYVPGKQVVFAARHWAYPVKLCASMKQIQTEQRASAKYRRLQGFTDSFHYGHVYVEAP